MSKQRKWYLLYLDRQEEWYQRTIDMAMLCGVSQNLQLQLLKPGRRKEGRNQDDHSGRGKEGACKIGNEPVETPFPLSLPSPARVDKRSHFLVHQLLTSLYVLLRVSAFHFKSHLKIYPLFYL
jgi:hypothetical protein